MGPLLRRLVATAGVLTCVFVRIGAIDAPPADNEVKTIRISDSALADLVDFGMAQSATLRGLIDHLTASHMIVYVMVNQDMTGGRLRLMAATSLRRYLRIDLTTRLPSSHVLALFGHELQHAVEVADEPSVVDDHTFEALYKRIGFTTEPLSRDGHRSYETNAAIAIGRRVFVEVCGPTTAQCAW
jgi:hypothetical protein